MRTMHSPGASTPGAPPPGSVVELPLLLPADELPALERAASRQGLTTAQLLRRLIRNFLGGLHDVPTGEPDGPLTVRQAPRGH
jgi:hypothetical protein